MNLPASSTQAKSSTKTGKALKASFCLFTALAMIACMVLEYELGPLRHLFGPALAAITHIAVGAAILAAAVGWLIMRFPKWTRAEQITALILVLAISPTLVMLVILTVIY